MANDFDSVYYETEPGAGSPPETSAPRSERPGGWTTPEERDQEDAARVEHLRKKYPEIGPLLDKANQRYGRQTEPTTPAEGSHSARTEVIPTPPTNTETQAHSAQTERIQLTRTRTDIPVTPQHNPSEGTQ